MKTSVIDYHVLTSGVIERGAFYNYMHELGYKDSSYTKEQMIHSTYPFGVCIKDKKLLIIESATICFLNQQNGKTKSIEEFRDIIEKDNLNK